MLSSCAATTDETTSSVDVVIPACDYTQIHGTADHGGTACQEQTGLRVVAVLEQDPDVAAEVAASGFYSVHQSTALTAENFVIVPTKFGFTGTRSRQTDRRGVDAYRWVPGVGAPDAQLVPAWSAKVDYQIVDAAVSAVNARNLFTNGFTAMFQPAIANRSVYVPARSGRVSRLDLETGALLATIDPLAGTPFSGDARTVGVGALSVDGIGNVYYTVTAFNATSNNNSDFPRESWLVVVHPNDTSTIVPWTQVAGLLPGASDLCEYPFGTSGTPAARDSSSRPPQFGCGPQRPAFNAAPAITRDNHIIVASYANNALGAMFLVELGLDLKPIRAMDTRGHMLHGCGVRLSQQTQACRIITDNGATGFGFDPAFNGPVRFRGGDIVTGSPVVGPDGSMTISGYTGGVTFGGGFDARGGLVAFDGRGVFRAVNDDFGFEVTPSVFSHDGTFSYLQDRNLYSVFDLGVARYSPAFAVERNSPSVLDPNAATPDFLDANIAFDSTGSRYAVNGDGHVSKFGADGTLIERIALPGVGNGVITLSNFWSRDRAGRLLLSYAGKVFVIAGGGPVVTPSIPAVASSALMAAQAAKRAAIGETPMVAPPQ